MAAAAVGMVSVGAACAAPGPRPPCERSLEGVWRTGAVVDGEAIGYHVLDRGGAIEGYPTFRDVPAGLPPGVQAAPAVLDLVRANGALIGGRWSRRFELGGQRCTVAAPVHVSRCEGRALVLELGPIAPPADWTACGEPGDAATLASAPMPAPAQVLTLQR